MPSPTPDDVTTILQELQAGGEDAQGRLLDLVYAELRHMAATYLRHEPPGHSWQTTDLVHEAVSRLLGAGTLTRSQDRSHFFGIASRTMRQLLVEHVRLRQAAKRGPELRRVPLDDLADYFERERIDVVAVRDALEHLATFHERQSQVITLRLFGGFTVEEVAAQLGVSVSTVESDYRLARAWLHAQLL